MSAMVRYATAASRHKARMENRTVHKSSRSNNAPDFKAVVTVPGPIKAADMTDQKTI